MAYAVVLVMLIALAAFAPRVAAVALGLALVVTLAVKLSAKAVSDVEPSLGDSFKGVAYALGLAGLLMLALAGAGGGSVHVEGALAMLFFAGLFGAYVAGFKLALGTGWRASALVAIVAAVVSAGFWFVARGIA